MAAIRVGTRVCMIMSMHVKGTVIELFEKKHRSVLVDGPLSKTMWAKVQLDNPGLHGPIAECRVGELMSDE